MESASGASPLLELRGLWTLFYQKVTRILNLFIAKFAIVDTGYLKFRP